RFSELPRHLDPLAPVRLRAPWVNDFAAARNAAFAQATGKRRRASGISTVKSCRIQQGQNNDSFGAEIYVTRPTARRPRETHCLNRPRSSTMPDDLGCQPSDHPAQQSPASSLRGASCVDWQLRLFVILRFE